MNTKRRTKRGLEARDRAKEDVGKLEEKTCRDMGRVDERVHRNGKADLAGAVDEERVENTTRLFMHLVRELKTRLLSRKERKPVNGQRPHVSPDRLAKKNGFRSPIGRAEAAINGAAVDRAEQHHPV